MHGDCHLPHKEKTPSEGKKNCCSLLFVCGSRRPLSFSWSSPMEEKVSSVLYVCCCKLLEGRKGRPADFPRPIPWFSRTSSLPCCCCASYVAGNLVHSVRREASRAAHTALTAPVQSERAACLPEGASAHARAHRRTHAHTHGHSDPPPDVTATSKAHWLVTWVIICSAVMWEACSATTPPRI